MYMPVFPVETTNTNTLSLGVLALDGGSILSLKNSLSVLVELQLGDNNVRSVETNWDRLTYKYAI